MSRHSLTGRRSFTRLYLQGNSWSGGGARIRYIIEESDLPRFAISVPKTCGNAVVRNRIRRRWRAAVRVVEEQLPRGHYQVILRDAGSAAGYAGALRILEDFRRHICN